MTFEMESEKHAINMTYDPVYGLTIIGLKCPHEKKLKQIKIIADNFQYEWITNDKIGNWYSALQKTISHFKENKDS